MFRASKKSTRLGQWNGRRRSSRLDEPVLPHLWRRPVLLRLATVLVTAAAVTGLIYAYSPLLPYRVAAPAGFARRLAPTMTDTALLTVAL